VPISENLRLLNGPMVERLRKCAADTSSNWDGKIKIYPPEARQLVFLIDESRELVDLAQAVPAEVRAAFVQAVRSARTVADGAVRRLTAELDKVRQERDSLARRCAVRFEETEKLRAELETMTAIAKGNKQHVADMTYQLERVEALTKDAAGNDLNGAEIVVAGKIRRALYEPLPDTRPNSEAGR
jgi:hypothetical protein